MKHTRLRGWNVEAKRIDITGQEDPDWVLIFTEHMPPTNDQILFEMDRATRDALVRQLTGGIVLYGGELPKL